MIEFKDIDDEIVLKIESIDKRYDDVIRTVYFDVFALGQKKSSIKFDAEEQDFLRLGNLFSVLVDSSKSVFPLIFNPLINAHFEIYAWRLNQNYQLEARFYEDNYMDYEKIIWEMDTSRLQTVIDQIDNRFSRKN